MPVAAAVRAVLLAVTSTAFFAPAYAALCKRLYPEACRYATLAVVSAFYHVADTIDGVNLGFTYAVWNKLDHYLAFTVIACTTLVLIDSVSNTDPVSKLGRVKPCVQFGFDILAVVFVMEGVHTVPTVVVISVLCVAVFCASVLRNPQRPERTTLVCSGVAVLCTTAGALCFFLCDTGNCYYLVHSLWHLLAAAAAWFVVIGAKSSHKTTGSLPETTRSSPRTTRSFRVIPLPELGSAAALGPL